MQNKHFLEMIQTLRQSEELILRVNTYEISAKEKEEVALFLKAEYKKESINYPNKAPAFDSNAAIYAAIFLYQTAQLILYREQREEDINKYYSAYEGTIDASAMVSADLCLRFIPHLLKGIILINADDPLIPILEKRMYFWAYSAIEIPNFNYIKFDIEKNKCITNLFLDRVIEFKNLAIAKHEPFKTLIKAKLGIYGETFWSGLYNGRK